MRARACSRRDLLASLLAAAFVLGVTGLILDAGVTAAGADKGHRGPPSLKSQLTVLLKTAEHDGKQHRRLSPNDARRIGRLARRLRHVRSDLPAACAVSLAEALRIGRDARRPRRLLADARAALAHLSSCPEPSSPAPVEHGVPTETPREQTEPTEPPKPPEEKPIVPPAPPAPASIKPVRAIVETYDEGLHVTAHHVDNNEDEFGGYNEGRVSQPSPIGPGASSTCAGLVCEVPLEANLAFTRKGEVRAGTEGLCIIRYGHSESAEPADIGLLRLEYDDDGDLISASLEGAPLQLQYRFEVGGLLVEEPKTVRGEIGVGEIEYNSTREEGHEEDCGYARAALDPSEAAVNQSLDPALLSVGAPAPVEVRESGSLPAEPNYIGPQGEPVYDAESLETTIEYEFSLKASIRLVPAE